MNKAKPRTKWIHVDYGEGKKTWFKVGVIKNPASSNESGYVYDCIRIQIRAHWEGQGDIDFSIRIDEAQSLVAGLGNTLFKLTGAPSKELSTYVRALNNGTL